MIKIANCGHDENGGYTGGKPGDQTGTEWQVINLYTPSYGWSYLIRFKNLSYAKQLANLATEAANNNKVGYCQGHRTTFEKELKKANWRPGDINEACEADCSAGVIGLIKAVANINNIVALKKFEATYTGNMLAAFRKHSDIFEVVSVGSTKKVGDILLTPGKHTTIIVSVDEANQSQAKPTTRQPAYNFDKKKAGLYVVNTGGDRLMMRAGAGTGYDIIARVANREKVNCYGYYNMVNGKTWIYVAYNGNVGFMSSDYLVKSS